MQAQGRGPRVIGLSSGCRADITALNVDGLDSCPAQEIPNADPHCFNALGSAQALLPDVSNQEDNDFKYADYGFGFGYEPYDEDEESKQTANDEAADYEGVAPGSVLGQIVGGQPAAPGRYAFVVNIAPKDSRIPFCGGVLISDDVVLTAAHCLPERVALGDIEVHVSRYNLKADLMDAQRFSVSRAVVHPLYQQLTAQNNDAVLLRLARSVPMEDSPFDSLVFPRLAGSDFATLPPHTELTIVGWGLTRELGQAAQVQQEGFVSSVTQADCRARYGTASVTDSMLCAGSNGIDACQGDSGGPLLSSSGTVDYLVGLVSWGEGCNRTATPGVYTSIPAIRPWVQSTLATWDTDSDSEGSGGAGPPGDAGKRFPYLAKIHRGEGPDCAGSLISPLVVLTSSKCTGGKSIQFGFAGAMQMIRIYGTPVLHPNASMGDPWAVEALLYRLEQPYEAVQPAILDDGSFTENLPSGLTVTQLGWNNDTTEINSASLTFLRIGSCSDYQGAGDEAYRQTEMCAAKGTMAPAACGKGVIGGPLVMLPRQEYWADVIIGVSKQPSDCNSVIGANEPFVRVFAIRDWIQNTLSSWGNGTSNFTLRVLPEDRIVGGQEVQPHGKYPYAVALSSFGNVKCGGSLIAPNVVLTAAHCSPSGVFGMQVRRSVTSCMRNLGQHLLPKPLNHFIIA